MSVTVLLLWKGIGLGKRGPRSAILGGGASAAGKAGGILALSQERGQAQLTARALST